LKKLSLIAGGVASLVLGTLLVTHSRAADHVDSLSLNTAANKMGDLNDVFTWMNGDATKLNLALTVSPADDGTRSFGPSVQYAFHVRSRVGTTGRDVLAAAGGVETNVICTFASNTSVQCWVVAGTTIKAYVKGDPSSLTGLTSTDGKLKVFAGRRSDPFFFNLQGLRNAVAGIQAAAAGLTFTNGCPNNLTDVQVGGLVATLAAQQPADAAAVPPCSATVKDCFAGFNVMALVVQVDKTLVVNGTDTFLSVWASTHAAP
jgi:hypothetical protein